jgi:hypothetical protein
MRGREVWRVVEELEGIEGGNKKCENGGGEREIRLRKGSNKVGREYNGGIRGKVREKGKK